MRIDQYESQFKSAVKERYHYIEPAIEKVLLVTDYDEQVSRELADVLRKLLPSWALPDWTIFSQHSYSSVRELLNKINEVAPDIIICQRDIKTSEANLVYGLSDYTDSLTQVTSTPVLLLPNFLAEDFDSKLKAVTNIMVQTNHLTGDAKLISWGTAFARPKGNLVLTHIEDDQIFKYYIDAISKIPEINTDVAEQKLRKELIKLPTDYINDAKEVLHAQFGEMTVEGIVKLGHTLDDYKELLDYREVDLLIINTKVDGQLAMSGRAYALAVELKELPLLLL